PADPPRHRPRPLPALAARPRRALPRKRHRLARRAHLGRAGIAPAGGSMSKIRLAIAGMGNCASSLVQGIEYYKDADPGEQVPGLMHVVLGGYHVRDIELVAAFDVDASKVGLDASKALFADIHHTIKYDDIPHIGAEVMRGPTTSSFVEYIS